jgi:tRNA G18 (ribose-2'-O)-methylase SpoU
MRANQIVHVYYTEKLKNVETWTTFTQTYRPKSVRKVSKDELDRISKSTAHEGLVLKTHNFPIEQERDLEAYLKKLLKSKASETLLILDRVSNPHNYGAIIRTAVFFGVTTIIQERNSLQARPSGAALKSACGGFEYVSVYEVDDLRCTLEWMMGFGCKILVSRPGLASDFSSRRSQIMGLLVGNEESGVRENLLNPAYELVSVPGCGLIESLNVAVATGVLLSQICLPNRNSLDLSN